MEKSKRIKKSQEFSDIIACKHSLNNNCFVLYFNVKKEDHCRVGISVSKKLGNAVIRNKIKRQVREIIKDSIDFNTYAYDFIVIVRRGFLANDFANNKIVFQKLAKRAIINEYEN